MQTRRIAAVALAVALLLLSAASGAAAAAAPRPAVPAPVPIDAWWIPDIWDVSTEPEPIGMVAVPDAQPVPEDAGRPDIIPIELRDAVAPEEVHAIAFPNPSSGPVTVRAEGLTPVSVHVYDVTGRVIADLAGRSGEAVWDGRDADGRSALPGVYFARVSAEGASAKTIRIVRR